MTAVEVAEVRSHARRWARVRHIEPFDEVEAVALEVFAECLANPTPTVKPIAETHHVLAWRLTDWARRRPGWSRRRRQQLHFLPLLAHDEAVHCSGYEQVEIDLALQAWAATLPVYQQHVLRGVLMGKTGREIAVERGVTESAISQALRRIRESYEEANRVE